MGKVNNIWVFSEKTDFLKCLCSGAVNFAEKVTVLLAGDKADAVFGHEVYYLGDTSEHMTEDYIPTIIALAKEQQPDAIFIGSGRTGRMVAGAVAAGLGTSAMTDISELTKEDALVTKRIVYGGAAYLTAKAAGTEVITIKEGFFSEEELPVPVAVKDIPFVEPAYKIKVTGHVEKPVQAVNLSAAKRIVCVGRGFPEKDDLQLAYTLAGKIGAEVGCTRAVTEGEDSFMDKSMYIGVSGHMLSPEIYMGIGVSGQIQHMVGINTAKTIIAVNKDERAPIFNQCDYGYVGDLKAILPLLIEKFQ